MLRHILRNTLVAFVFTASVAAAQADTQTTDLNHEFDAGSRISLTQLSPVQVGNLAIAGKVWGFLKYHHPSVVGGQHQWDYELLRILPAVLAAPDRDSADVILHGWIGKLGPITECSPCAKLDKQDFQLLPNLEWLNDTHLLSAELRNDLNRIHLNRGIAKTQSYISMVPLTGNPMFDKEAEYKELKFPDAGFQLLSLFRFWNIVEYWAPYREQIGEDWDNVLRESITPVALSKDRSAYELAMIAVIARINDTHANLWSSLQVRPPVGACQLPLRIRFVEGAAAVSGYTNAVAGAATGLRPGDVIESIDGVPVSQLVDSWRPYYAASNEPTRLRDVAENMTIGACGRAQLKVRQDDGVKEVSLSRLPRTGQKAKPTHDKEGDTFQLLTEDIAYIKLSSVKRDNIPDYMERAAHTKGLIIDIRNYPSDFVPFVLGPYFIDKPTKFVRFTAGDLANPGGFKWGPELTIAPKAAHYAGKVMILVDEKSQSQSEYTAMALRVGSRAKVVGSTTAGADGNVSAIPLPGGLRTMISGIGVFYPDKRPTQRIGIIPDIEVKPTIKGLRAMRDEVLDAAIAEIQRE
ncbi:peptidase S41 [Rugamonas sp. FT82W]|uniref:Peptidase S41 n=1 Tax=Duganella vulcania TaxID=2692166 RepID=A0A845FZ18_9BURK|nr:S41 family peptidase [Duganella vulcania]MYM86365.1 peptidase S41 [Duganella vulcania]